MLQKLSILFLSAAMVACGGTDELVVVTEDQEVVADAGQMEALAESMPAEIYADGELIDDPSGLLTANHFEFRFEEVNISATRTEDGVEIEASDGTTTSIQLYTYGTNLEFEGQATVFAPSEEVAGMVMVDAIRNVVAMQQQTSAYGVNPYQCWYSCYEISIGLGLYLCRYYPNGLGSMFKLEWHYLPCFKGKITLSFTCNYLWYLKEYNCSGTTL